MNDNIIVALISVFGSMLGSATLINWRLKSLEQKVEEHNGYAKMFNEHTLNIALMQKDISFIKDKLGGK